MREKIAVNLIDKAGLNPASYRLARRLVDRAIYTRGITIMTRAGVQEIAEVATWRGCRKLLQQCADAGIDWTSPNSDTVTITVNPLIQPVKSFSAQNGPEAPDALQTDRDQNGPGTDLPHQPDQNGPQNRSNTDRMNAKSVQDGPENGVFRIASHARTRSVSQLVDHDLSTDQNETNYLTTQHDQSEDHAWIQAGPGDKHSQFVARKLLIDPEIGIDYKNAREIASRYALTTIRRAVQKYVAGKESGQFRSAGIIIEWLIKKPGLYSLPFSDPEFERSELFLRHLTIPEEKQRQASAIEAAQIEQEVQAAREHLQARPEESMAVVVDSPSDAPLLEALRNVLRDARSADDAEAAAGIVPAQRSTIAQMAGVLGAIVRAEADKHTLVLWFTDPVAANRIQRMRGQIVRQLRIKCDERDIRIIIHMEKIPS